MDTTGKQTVSAFGLIIVGSEVLDGRVQDKHFAAAQELLRERSVMLQYVLILQDQPALIEAHLRWAMAQPAPFFCCGGIGATPDDYTRDCAARVAGVPLEFHPEGLAILQERFGKDATPARMRLVEFPKGAQLIPNPFNRVPGFTIRNGHFLPGFPEMARPMMAWVLDHLYTPGPRRIARALVLPGGREGDLVEMMERFVAQHPDVTFSSLPKFVPGGTEVRLGLAGAPDAVDAGFKALTAALDARGTRYEEVPPAAAVPAAPGSQGVP